MSQSSKIERILLIYPPVTIYGAGKINPHIPLGLLYIATYLKRRDYQVKIVDAIAENSKARLVDKNLSKVGLGNSKIFKYIDKFKPDLIGISVMYSAFEDDGIRLANKIKLRYPKTPIVLGGSAISVKPITLLKENKRIEYAIKGEGELSMIQLIEALGNKSEFTKVSGLAWRKNNKIVLNDIRFIKNLDDIEHPDYSLLKLNKYFEYSDPFAMRKRVFPLVTSRGCPNHCVYCSIHSVYNHRWRGRSPEDVIKEIKELVNNYQMNSFVIQDDSVSVDLDRLKRICKLMIKNNLYLKWTTPNGIAHWTLDKPALKLMKKSGCYRITFGIESGNQEIRRWVGKPYDLGQAKKLIKYANQIGMWTLTTNIIGFPYESRSQIEDTIKYAIDSDVDFAFFFRLSPRPGTPVYKVFEKEGWLPKNKKYMLSEDISCRTRYFNKGELLEIQAYAYRQFLKRRLLDFLNPKRILLKINSLEDLLYVIKLGFYGTRMALNTSFSKKGATSKVYRS